MSDAKDRPGDDETIIIRVRNPLTGKVEIFRTAPATVGAMRRWAEYYKTHIFRPANPNGGSE